MIVSTKSGVFAAGTIGEPELKYIGQNDRPVLKFSLKYDSEKDEAGKNVGKYLDVDVWDDAEALDGMFAKGDAVAVAAKEIKSRDYGGKTYHSVSASGVFVSAQTVFRWMQQIVDMIPVTMAGPMEFTPASEPPPAEFMQPPVGDIAGGEMYEGEQLSSYAPRMPTEEWSPGEPLIGGEDDDLPF